MAVIVFEDDDGKFSVISSALEARHVPGSSIKRVRSAAEFATLNGDSIDLCIIDLMMPSILGGTPREAGLEILQMLNYSGQRRVPVLAITAFKEEMERLRPSYAEQGCIIYDFNSTDQWKKALDIFLAQAKEKGRYKFIVFCALKSERDAYLKIPSLKIESTTRYGVDHWDVDLSGVLGTIILLPRMGLVSASVLAAKVLEIYSPKIVCMSGICAGIGKDTILGQLLIADLCWEYQSGKWLDDMFLAEPYQTKIPNSTRLFIRKALEDGKLLNRLEEDFAGSTRPTNRVSPTLAIFATGSAVIASEERLKHVKDQHRRVSGLDMEIYGLYEAIEMSGVDCDYFAAKVVVDRANNSKSDDLHDYGSYVSACFCRETIEGLLGR